MRFVTKKCSSLSPDEVQKCSALFSNNYGYYSANAPKRAGERIRLGARYYEEMSRADNTYVALAYNGDDIVGQAFYVLEKTDNGYLSWVTQLVVREDFRKQSIAKTLLLSIWGFSNDRAWGLATTNPLTIKTLESATFRKVSFGEMAKNIDTIKEIGGKVSFIDTCSINIDVDNHNATVDTGFFVDHETIAEKIKAYGEGWPYSHLNEGKEWLAFVFQEQAINISPDALDKLLDSSEKCLIDAYSRMQTHEHPWARGTEKEVDFIMERFPDKDKSIIDFGCGTGRHLFELKSRGYEDIFGIDFSGSHIQYCKDRHPECANLFEQADCREYSSKNKFDYALCLYDVIGTFPKNDDNIKILAQLYQALRDGGRAIVSVMNMEMTVNIAKTIANIYENPGVLFKLKASDIMQSTGEIFDPDYFIIDTCSGNVFRKEKFANDDNLHAEYIVRDRRYHKHEIEEMAKRVGFDVLESRFVNAGDWEKTKKNTEAKEILLVLEKKCLAS